MAEPIKELPEPGEVWRRKANGFLVKITELRKHLTDFDVLFEAHERKPRQPSHGRKWLTYFLYDFEKVS